MCPLSVSLFLSMVLALAGVPRERDDTTTSFFSFYFSFLFFLFSRLRYLFVSGILFCMILEFMASRVQGVRKVESGPAHEESKAYTYSPHCFFSLFAFLLVSRSSL